MVLDREPGVGLVCSNARVIDESGTEIRALYLTNEAVSSDSLAALVNVNFVVISSAVARGELLERVGGFTEDIRLRGVEDYDLWLRVGAVSRLAYLAEPLLAYRRHRGSMMAGVPRRNTGTTVHRRCREPRPFPRRERPTAQQAAPPTSSRLPDRARAVRRRSSADRPRPSDRWPVRCGSTQ